MKRLLFICLVCAGCSSDLERAQVKQVTYKVVCLDSSGQPIPGLTFTNLILDYGSFYKNGQIVHFPKDRFVAFPE